MTIRKVIPRYWSTGCLGRRVGEQAALSKVDAVDQDHPEDEADEARRHAEPPIEFRQIDRRERKRRRQISVISIMPTIVPSPNSSR